MSQIRQMNFCKICKKKIVAKVWKIHVMGKKHLYFTPKTIKVSGAFNSDRVEEVHKYFSQFGTIGSKVVNIENGKMFIEYSFQDKRAHSFIIYKEHRLFNQPVDISWNEVKGPFPGIQNIEKKKGGQKRPHALTRTETSVEHRNVNKKVDSETSKRNIINSVKDGENFSEQIRILLNKLQPNVDKMQMNKKLIYDDLTSALAPMFSLSRICFFGSSITGLDVQGSDLDVYIANVREGSKPEVQTLKLIRHLIFKCRKFCDVLLISGAKIPIIKCIHTKTQMCCDLNIRNKLSVCNSELIKYYLSLDDKLRPLMIMIKFWAECYDLKKVNFFSSYALYMMVIFYLQQEPYKLPAVKDLQSGCTPDMVDGWNCAFERREFSNMALKTVDMEYLVAGFFRFYNNFDYVTNVISPYLGYTIKKTCFLQPYDLPEGFENYKNQGQSLYVTNPGICIQDPFEHGRNVSTVVPLQCVGKFTAICKISLEMIENNEKDLLYNLLTLKNISDYTFEIERPVEETPIKWKEKIQQLIERIITEVLCMKLVQTGSVYTCVGDQNIWESRINISKNLLTKLPPNTSDLNREIAISKCIVKYLPQTLTTNMSVNIIFKPNTTNPSRVIVQMRPLNKKCRNFLHVSHYFFMNLKRFLDSFSTEERTISTPPPQTRENLLEREFCPADEMTQKDDKINEESEFTDSLSGKQDVTSDPADPVPDTNVADQKDPEEEEEDVPADFFDDFSNQDFMDGLDIVDAWDDEPNVDTERARKKPHSPIRFIKSRTPDRKSKRRRSKSPGRPRRSNSKRSKSRENVRTTDRRDPEKTRRDIHRDKIKVAKDKEQKLVNDKLRIVETGLVPPGTEMDVDISTIITEKRKTEERQRERDVTRDRERERELARERERESARERERELAREREKESARERERELARERELVRERELIREREARDREQERQLARDRDREVVRERDLKNDREKRYSRRSSSRDRKRYSPSPRSRGREKERDVGTRSRRRTASRESNLSERELWIRSNRKRTRSRSRSRSKKYEEAKKKKTFLEEIRDKLNETRSVVQSITPGPPSYTYNSIVPQHSMPTPTPAPAPVPAPNQYFSPVPAQQYDQRFFIGDAYQPSNVNFGMIAPVPPVQVPQMRPVTAPAPVMTPTPVPPLVTNDQKPVFPHKINILSDIMLKTKTEEKKEVEKNPIEDIDKLFADKKISLSDFLTITAKCEVQSSSPDHLQKKIKVISRCQDAIKAMSDDHKFTGRLSVKQVTELKNKGDVKYQSPLRRIPIVRFQFTTPAKITEDTDVFALALDKILQRIGILKENTNMDEVAEVVTNSSFADEETTATTLKATLLGMKKTDVKSECEECKKRKMKTFTEVGSQCVDNKDTVSIGVQVLEEDFNSTKGLMKNDSIAYLTPAQLLGKEKEKDREIENPQSLKPEKSVDKKLEPAAASTSPMKKEKPRPLLPARGRGRGRGRAPLIRDRPFNNSFEYQDEYYDDFYDNGRNIYEDPRDSFGARFEHPLPVNYQRQEYIEDDAYLARLHQFREEEGGFLDFSQPYRGGPRGGRYGGPRF